MMHWLGPVLASNEEIDKSIHDMQPGWKSNVIYQSLKDGDKTSWAILLTVVGFIVLLVIAQRVTKKLMED